MHTLYDVVPVLFVIVAWIAIVIGVIGEIYVLLFFAFTPVELHNPSWAPWVPIAVVAFAVLFLIFRHRMGL